MRIIYWSSDVCSSDLVNTMAELSAKTLELNDIGVAEVYTDRGIVFERYGDDRDLGGFILIDKVTNATVGAGLIKFALRRSQNVHWQAIEISREAHAAQKSQRPHLRWFTGLSGSGKSTIDRKRGGSGKGVVVHGDLGGG